ncbi:MAG: hypothetical protein KDE14_06915 [Rhodobacteraceae bacterium]|nr:hypothetical protein [Paracoccaceae bacterium]
MTAGPEADEKISQQPHQYYDWLLNLWGSQILRAPVLTRAKKSLNIHPSLLPLGKGRDPVVWALRNLEPAGVTLHAISPGVDEGPVWYQEQVPYNLPTTGGELYRKVIARCKACFIEQWPMLRTSEIEPKPQAEMPDQNGVQTRKRKDLFADQILDADAHPESRDVILRLLAHDFGDDYHLKVKLAGKSFGARLLITPDHSQPPPD